MEIPNFDMRTSFVKNYNENLQKLSQKIGCTYMDIIDNVMVDRNFVRDNDPTNTHLYDEQIWKFYVTKLEEIVEHHERKEMRDSKD
jgi:hypothetical protein